MLVWVLSLFVSCVSYVINVHRIALKTVFAWLVRIVRKSSLISHSTIIFGRLFRVHMSQLFFMKTCSSVFGDVLKVETRLIWGKYWWGTFFFLNNDVAMKPRWSRTCGKGNDLKMNFTKNDLKIWPLCPPAILLVARIRHPWSRFSNRGFLRGAVRQAVVLKSHWILFGGTPEGVIETGVLKGHFHWLLFGGILKGVVGTGSQRWGGEASEHRGRVWFVER